MEIKMTKGEFTSHGRINFEIHHRLVTVMEERPVSRGKTDLFLLSLGRGLHGFFEFPGVN